MPRFRYVAMDGSGAETEGVVEAESQSQAVNAIRRKGLFPTRVSEVGGGSAPKAQSKSANKRSNASSSTAAKPSCLSMRSIASTRPSRMPCCRMSRKA